MPFPGLCERCAVNGCGLVGDLKPTTMQVLHIEASYLCHLSCPQCIPARDRKHLRGPPFHMTIAMMENVLRQIKVDGVSELQFVHFEGRGDPLANPHLVELISLAKQHFPRAFIGATTHGSYPYMSWIVESDLDLLRISVDGAEAESYRKYRVGGNFHTAISFMEALKRARQQAMSKLQVEWKYILFEWNDSDDEMRTAFRMSQELDVRLHFCLTHSPGRSKRFPTKKSLEQAISILAPGTSCDTTFQLKTDEEKKLEARSVAAQYATSSIIGALEMVRQNNEPAAISKLLEALRADPGFTCNCEHTKASELLERHMDTIVADAKSPATLSWLAAICREYGEQELSSRLLWRYLEIAPHAPDYDHVLQDLTRPATAITRIVNKIRKSLSYS